MKRPDKICVLYVDDEVNNLNSFKATFRRDFDILTATSGKEALEVFANNQVHVILTDQRMPEMTGVEFLVEVLKISTDPMRLLITGYTDINAVVEAVNLGHIYHYFTKPWNEDHVRLVINNAFEVYYLRDENKELTEQLMLANNQLEFLLRQKLIS